MKKVLFTLLIFASGCYTAKQASEDSAKHRMGAKKKVVNLSYEYKIIYPLTDNFMNFEDSTISANFVITENEIDFTLYNKTSNPLRVNWDDASMGIFGNSNKIMHKGIKYSERNNSMTSTTILPNTSLDDLALPTDNVYFSDLYSDWKEKPLLPSRINLPKDSILLTALKDQKITLYLPIIDTNNKNLGYTFKFIVSDIIKKY